MLFRLTLRSIGSHRGADRARLAPAIATFVLAVLAAGLPRATLAGPGSGSASLAQPDSAVAGSRHQWTILYNPSENFGNPQGGVLEIRIPDGWTPPQRTSSALPGYVDYTNASAVTSLSISGQNIRLVLGGGPPATKKFEAWDLISVLYGLGGPNSLAVTGTVAGTDRFTVLSDPQNTGTLDTLATGSPRVRVLPDTVTVVKIVDAAGVEVSGLVRTTDQDNTTLYLRGYDRYGNAARFVNGTWSVSGGIGVLADPTASSRRLVCTTVGSGKVYADSSAWRDSTDLILVSHGSYASLAMTSAPVAVAGAPLAATVESRDADGNRITTGPGSAAAIRFVAFADSLGAGPADPSFTNPGAVLSAGAWSGTLTARRSGTFFIVARDTVTGFVSSPRRRLEVDPAVPDRIEIRPDTLRLTAGVPDTMTIVARDVFGNRAPFAAAEELTLWTDRPLGRFENFSGTPIFTVTIPAGSDSAEVRFRNTQASPGLVRAIDANGAAPFVGTATAPVYTAPAPPAGALVVAAAPDTLVADGADSALVRSGVVRDAFGNAVASGERFSVSADGVVPVTDADPGAPGAQWTVGADSTVSGWVRAGTATGAASVDLASERGSATGSAALALIAGPPAGAIALAASPDSVAADGIATRAVTAAGLRDAFANPVLDGEPYTVSTTLGAIATADADPLRPGVQVLASGGAIAFDLLGGTTLGVATVSAASVRGAAAGSVDVRLVPGAVDADSSFVGATTPVAVGSPGSTVTVTLRDRAGHGIPGVPADSIEVASTGVQMVVTPLASATDAAGVLAFSATATAAGSAPLTVEALGVSIAAPTVVFEPAALDTLVVSGPAGPLTAGVPDSIVVVARDAFGNAMPGRSDIVHASVSAGGATGLPASTALSGGRATIVFTPTAASPLTIAVADDSSHAATWGPVAVRAGPPWSLVADPPASDTLQAGGSTTLRARVVDAFGNASPGDTVAASVVTGGGSILPAAAVTDAAGAADFTLNAGGAPGPVTVRLEAVGSAAADPVRSDSVSVVVLPSAAATVEIVAAGSATAGVALDVAVTLRDAFGNVATGATPTLQLDTSSSLPDSVAWSLGSGAAGSLTDGPSDDRATYSFAATDSGTTMLRVRFTRAETVRATVAGVGGGSESGDIVITPAAAASLAEAGGQSQTGVVDRELAQALRVEARDGYGNPVPGAVVAFRVRAGGGSLDVIRGAPADSDAVTDAAGVARCEVVRLGTSAGTANHRIAATLAAGDSVVFLASALPDTAASLALAPASLALGPGGTALVTATARDRFSNPVPGEPLTLHLGSSPAGSLESTGATAGTGTTQAGSTDASGGLVVRYRAPTAAPAGDVVFARTATLGPVSIPVSIAPAAADSLAVLPDAATWIAGDSVRVRVRALDASGNLALGDTTTVVMGATAAGVTFRPSFGPLAGGEFVTFATATVAGPVAATARAAAGSETFASGTVTVRPAAPAGAIPIAAGRDTLTADGRSTTTLVFGPLRDAFGNTVVTGTLLTVSADSLLAADASPAPGLQIATGADDLARAVLVAPAAPGSGMVRAASAAGSARDSLAIVYLPPPSLALASPPAPSVVAPGQSISFTASVTNIAATGSVTLGTSSVFSFGSGPAAFLAMPAAAVTIPAGATRSLAMSAATVSTALQPGTYAPSLRLVGTDATGDPLDFYLPLSGAQVHVAGIRVAAVSASPDPVPLGHGGLVLTFRVENLAAAAATVDAVALAPSTFVVNSVSPPLPAALGALGSTTLALTVTVPASGIPPGTVVSADLAASAAFGTVSVNAVTPAPLPFTVVSGAALAAQAAGTAPARFLRGRTFAPRARVANTGSTAITLSPGSTRLVLERGASRLEAGLTASAAVPAGGTADLGFDSLAVPANAALGRHAARLVLSGVESGQAFADTIPLAPDSLDVVDPAMLSIAGALAPDTVSAGQTRSIQVMVSNAGGVPFVLATTSRLALGPPLSASLAPVAAGAVPAGGSLVVTFAAEPLGSPLTPPGAALAVVEARGTEDGVPRSEALAAGSLSVESPARLVYVAGSTAPDTVRAGETLPVTVTIRNEGGSPFTVDPAATTLLVTDGVESATGAASGAPFALLPGTSAALAFPSVAFPAALASQPYPVALMVRGFEWGLAGSLGVVSGAGELRVVEPVAAVQVRALDPGAPIQLVAEDGPVSIWTLELQPLVPVGGSASAHLFSIAFTAVVDGVVPPDASATIARITLRDGQGNVLGEAPGAAASRTAVALGVPLALTGPPVTVRVEIAVRPGSTARSVALRLAAPGDVAALDDLTQSPLSVRAAGGLPFEPVTSPAVTLFEKPHGYPNPFRAGREDVRLSYRLAADATVRVSIYTLLGDLVRELSLAAGSPGGLRGLNEVPWDGRNGRGETVRPGVYVARIEGGGVNEQVKVGVLR